MIWKRIATFVLLSIGVAWCALPAAARAHPGQSLGLNIAIGDEEVAYSMLISADFLEMLLEPAGVTYELRREGAEFHFIVPEEQRRTQEAIIALLDSACPVRIDGVRVKPILRELRFVSADLPGGRSTAVYTLPPDARVVLIYPIKGRPKHVSMVWGLYPEDFSRLAFGLDAAAEVVAELDAYDENKIIIFTVDEPEIIWHATGQPARATVSPVVAEVQRPTIPIPLLSAGLGCAALVVLLVVRVAVRSAAWRRASWAMVIVLLATAAWSHDRCVARVRAPWEPAVRAPDQQEAADVFAALHSNVYRAFDYKSESDIYDVLAQSVDGALLDQIYNEVYQSLIMRDQGGAVARIKNVDVLEADVESAGVLPDERTAAFRVRARWRVHGAVYHWGHVHARTNEYKALYTVAQRDANWKITAVEVLEQRRIVSDADKPPARRSLPPGEPL